MTDELQRVTNQRDYNRRLADHLQTVINKMNAEHVKQQDHIAAQDAKIAKLVEALRNIAIADIQQMRVDDCLREAATALSLASIGETDD